MSKLMKEAIEHQKQIIQQAARKSTPKSIMDYGIPTHLPNIIMTT